LHRAAAFASRVTFRGGSRRGSAFGERSIVREIDQGVESGD
jgi:hypothetical protein